jgi:hypothetical protein
VKFTLNNDLRNNPLMRRLIGGLVFFLLLFLTLDLVYKAYHIGFAPSEVSTYLFGNEEAFVDPVDFTALLESVHADIFFIMMVLLSLGAVYGRLFGSRRYAPLLIHITMCAALIAIIAPLAAYGIASHERAIALFVVPFWIAALYIWHLGAILMGVASLVKVIRP